jgi:hypothetical protein
MGVSNPTKEQNDRIDLEILSNLDKYEKVYEEYVLGYMVGVNDADNGVFNKPQGNFYYVAGYVNGMRAVQAGVV